MAMHEQGLGALRFHGRSDRLRSQTARPGANLGRAELGSRVKFRWGRGGGLSCAKMVSQCITKNTVKSGAACSPVGFPTMGRDRGGRQKTDLLNRKNWVP